MLCESIVIVASWLAFNPSRAVAFWLGFNPTSIKYKSYAECGWLWTSAGFVFIRLACFDQSVALKAGTKSFLS